MIIPLGTAAGSTDGIGATIVSADARTMMVLAISSWVSCGHAWKAVVWEVLYKLGIPEPTEGGVPSPLEQETHNILSVYSSYINTCVHTQ